MPTYDPTSTKTADLQPPIHWREIPEVYLM